MVTRKFFLGPRCPECQTKVWVPFFVAPKMRNLFTRFECPECGKILHISGGTASRIFIEAFIAAAFMLLLIFVTSNHSEQLNGAMTSLGKYSVFIFLLFLYFSVKIALMHMLKLGTEASS